MVGRRKKDYDLPPRMYQKHGSYYFVSRDNSWINLGKELGIAKRKWAELSGETPTGGMGALMDRYLAEVAPLKSPRSFKDNKLEAENLRKVFGQMEPRSVKPMHVAKYLDIRGKDAPVRANREKALLSHMFTMAMRWGVVDANPCRGVHRNTEVKRDRYISDQEFAAVWKESNLTIRCLMDLAYLTAQRIGDLLELRRADVTDAGIYFEQNKTGKKLLVQMTPELRNVVDRTRRIHPTVKGMFLFTTREGKPSAYEGISSMFKRSVKKAGIEDFHFHDIRAKALTDANRAGQNAQSLAGHATEAMTAHYIKRREVESVAPLGQLVQRKSV
jgi:integrase